MAQPLWSAVRFAGTFGGTLQNAADGIAANMFSSPPSALCRLTVFVISRALGGYTWAQY